MSVISPLKLTPKSPPKSNNLDIIKQTNPKNANLIRNKSQNSSNNSNNQTSKPASCNAKQNPQESLHTSKLKSHR